MSAPVQEGDLLAGKYRVERVLGSGGMGVVVSAVHTTLGQKVAVKFLLPEACANGAAVARFLREARAAVRIQSEHVARVIDVGTLETGAPYMVMEFLRGQDLSQELAARGPLPVTEAIDYVMQAIEAVAEAHALGIVHRDLKPANLFLTRRADGSAFVKVLDFGISKVREDQGTDVSLTATQTAMGSPQYMSPEQIRSAKDVDSRTDVWSLGVVLYELLAAAPPFQATTLNGLLAQIIADPPVPLRQMRPELPERLEAVVARCLEKDRTQRMANVAELSRALLAFGNSRAIASVERVTGVLSAAGLGLDGVAPTVPPPPLPVDDDRKLLEISQTAHLTSSRPEAEHSGTSGAWGNTNAPAARRGRQLLFGMAAVLVLASGALVGLKLAGSGTPPASASSAAALVPAPDPAPAASLAVPSPIETPPVVAASAAPPVDSARSAPAPVVGAPARPTQKVAGAAPAARPAKTAAPAKGAGIDVLDGRK